MSIKCVPKLVNMELKDASYEQVRGWVTAFIFTNNEYENQYWFVIFLVQRVGNQWYKG